MSIHTEIGTIVRTLPEGEDLHIKLSTANGSMMLEVPSDRPELIDEARAARVSGEEMRIRRTGSGLVVALQPNRIARAA